MKILAICFFLCWSMLTGLHAQTKFDYYYMEAEKCRLAGDYASAAELYQHCLDIRPDAPDAIYSLALIQFYLRQDSVGIQRLRMATELDAKNPWYLETLANVYISQRDIDSAIPVLEKIASLQSRRSDVLSELAQMYKNAGRSQDAIDALNRIELLEGKSAQLSIEKYALYLDLKEKEKAFAELQSLCDEFPHDMNYKVLVGNQYLQSGELKKAKQIYDEVAKISPDNPHLLLSMLAYYEESKQFEQYAHLRDSLLYDSNGSSELRVALMRDYIDKAQRDSTLKEQMEQAFQYILSQPQHDTQLLMLRASYLIHVKAPDTDVMNVMKQILEVDPSSDLAMSRLLQYYAIKTDYTNMEDICRRGVNYHPEELGYHFYLGVALVQQKKVKEAIDVFQQGLRTRSPETAPSLVSDVFSILGDEYFEEKMESQAFAAYDSALVYQEDNISCLNNYAYYLCLQNRDLDKAEEMSYKTIKKEPTNKTYLDTYAWILFTKKEYTEARIYMDRVISPEATDERLLSDDEATAALLEHAGDIYYHCGEPEKAFRYWQVAQKKGGTDTGTLDKKIKQKKYVK